MRRALWCFNRSSNSSRKKRHIGSSPFAVLEDVQCRIQHHVGLSATRKRVLLRDCRRIATMEQAALAAFSSSHQAPSAGRTTPAGSTGSEGMIGGELCRVLRSVVEFIASTGDCSERCNPPQRGYADLKPARKGIQRAALVVRYAEAILSISNSRLDAIAALTFGRHHTDNAGRVTTARIWDANQQQQQQWVQGGGVDDGGPLTPLEVMSLLQWCAWHVQTALNGLQHEGPLTLDELSAVVALLSRFLAVLVDGGLRRGAVETVTDELALGDVTRSVTDQTLRLLHFNADLAATNVFPPTRLAETSPESDDKKKDACWRGIGIDEETQQALLCTQRECWVHALEMLLKTQRWNNRINRERPNTATTTATSTSTAGGRRTADDMLGNEVLRTITTVPRIVLQTLQYILAQHGQWYVCMELWKETVLRHRRSEVAVPSAEALRHPFNTENIITALAFVNSGTPLSSLLTEPPQVTSVGDSANGSPGFPGRLLQLLLGLGIVPHRALSAAEFAAVLRQSFGLPLGRDNATRILSPSFVWRAAKAHPHHVRMTLCLLCFHVVFRSGLAHTLQLEDLYVVASVSRQFLQGQLRAASRAGAAAVGLQPRGEGEGVFSGNTPEEREGNAPGLLPITFALATRRSAIATEAHIVAITEAFLSRRRELLPIRDEDDDDDDDGDAGEGREKGGEESLVQRLKHVRTAIGRNKSSSNNNDKNNNSSSSGSNKRNDVRGNRSTVVLSLVSRELMAILTMAPYVNAVGVMWQAALCAISTEIQSGSPDRDFAAAVECLSHAMAKKVLEPGGTALLEPLVHLAPFLSPFAASKVVRSLVGRLLTWEHCLHLLPCTPWASNVQWHLLRRVMQERDVSEFPCVQSVLRAAKLPPRLLLHASPTLVTEVCMLAILAERDWCRALHAYTQSGSRVQHACASHIVHLVACTDVCHLHIGDGLDAMGSVFRVAMRTIGGERVAEKVLRTTLNRGLWASGLAFHQLLQEDHPEMLRANNTMGTYASLLCRGLLSHTAFARAIAEVLRSARRARWSEACGSFLQHVALRPNEQGQHHATEERGGMDAITTFPNYWSSLFRASVPVQLSHFAHTVRYSMLHTPGMWEQAMRWFPAHTLPLPLRHQLQLWRLAGVRVDSERLGKTTPVHDGTEDAVVPVSSAAPLFSSPLSLSLVQVALQEKLHCTRAPEATASVEQTLRVLQRRGQWEQAMLVYEHALANRCFPHAAGAVVLAACHPSWEASLIFFAHLTNRMRPDLVTTELALQACSQSRQWTLALRILQQSLLTTSAPAPRIVDHAVQAVLRSGVWRVALRLARQYRCTTSPLLVNTIMQTYVQTRCWNDAVGFFYECVMRGIRPLDESLAMAITASRAVSAEYRDAARVVGVIASALEDLCHVHGVLLEHVLVVYRGMMDDPLMSLPSSQLMLVSLARTSSNVVKDGCSSNGIGAAPASFP